jgi:hypothetical protein
MAKKSDWENFETFTETFRMRVSMDFLKTLDDWRRQEEDLPSRSEAARRLIEAGIKAERRYRK